MSSRYNASFALSGVELGIMVSVNILFSSVGTIGNILVCFAFLLHRNLRNAMNVFIFSLACSDLLVCVVAQPMFVARLVKTHSQEEVTNVSEDIRKRLTWISMLASIGNLLGVTLDRYSIISSPLKYVAQVKTNSACVFVAIVWIVASILGIITESYVEVKFISQICVVVLVAAMIIPLYCRILCIARRHARIIHTSLRCHVETNCTADKLNSSMMERSAVRKADRNSLKTVGIICSIFIIGWFPLLVLPFLYREGTHDRNALLEAIQWANTLALCSSACNPIVYSWRDRRFRKALTMTYGRWKARRSVSAIDLTSSDRFELRTFVRMQ